MARTGIFAQQTSIGWKNFFRGHVASIFQDWCEYNESADHWTFKLIRFMWTKIKELWDIRNSREHGDAGQQVHKRREKILNELKKVYDEKEKVMAIDRDQFFDTPEDHLKEYSQLSQVSTWISMIKNTIKISKDQVKSVSTKE